MDFRLDEDHINLPGDEFQNREFQLYEQRHHCSTVRPSQDTPPTYVTVVQSTAKKKVQSAFCTKIVEGCSIKMVKEAYITTKFGVFQQVQRY